GRHVEVGFGGLPVGALLGLKAVASEGAVVGSGAGNAGEEEFGVGEQVGSHEDADGFLHSDRRIAGISANYRAEKTENSASLWIRAVVSSAMKLAVLRPKTRMFCLL